MKKILLALGLAGSLFANMTFNSNDLCYKSRNYPLDYHIAFKAMENTLLNSNMHIKQINEKDGFISAEGTKSYGDTLYTFTFTVVLTKQGDLTHIKTIVSYDTVKNENEVKSVSTLNIPIPVPWSKVFKYKGTTNVDAPQFFDSFYTTFDLNVFNYEMKQINYQIKIEENKTKKDSNLTKKLDIISKEINKTKVVEKNITKNIKSELNTTKNTEKNVSKIVDKLQQIKNTNNKTKEVKVDKKTKIKQKIKKEDKK